MAFTFSTMAGLEKYLNSKGGTVANSLIDEKQIAKILTEAGQLLERYMKEELAHYFNNVYPEPKVYKRTGDTLASFRVGKPRKVNKNEWSIDISFDDDLANHPSVIGDGQPDGYTPWLLNTGWDIREKIPYNAPMFTHHPGTNYVQKAVNKFNSNNKHGLKVEVFHNGKNVTGRIYSYGR